MVSEERGGDELADQGLRRFHFIYQFLGLPYRDVTLLPPGGEAAKL